MTSYNLRPPINPLPFSSWQEAKEKRRAVLAKAAATRKANYRRFMQKQRAFSNKDGDQGEI